MNRAFLVPWLVAGWLVGAGLLLVGIVLFGPYTHSNLQPRFSPTYTRTNQTVVGQPELFGGMPGMAVPQEDQISRGHALFVTNECASCHGLHGQGGTVGPTLSGTSAADLRKKTTAGSGAMPVFDPSTLSDDGLAAMAAYLAGPAAQH